jgi:DNA polymerase-1
MKTTMRYLRFEVSLMSRGLESLDRFDSIYLFDTEFYTPSAAVNSVSYRGKDGEEHTDTGNVSRPVAVTAYELRTRTKTALGWPELDTHRAAPYSTGPNDLFVAFFASAEIGSHFALGWEPPQNVIDLYAEFRRLHNYPRIHPPRHFYDYDVTRLYQEPDPFPYPPKYCPELDTFDPEASQRFSLLDARETYKLPPLATSAHKTTMRHRIMKGPPYRDDEMRAILNYCLSDTMSLQDLLLAMLPHINVEHALLRGDYMRAVAWQEYRGIPIDQERFPQLLTHWETIKSHLIADVDRQYGFYVDNHFDTRRFIHYLHAHGIPWRLTKSGQPMFKDEYFKEQCEVYPELEEFRQLRKTVGKAKKLILAVGEDYRHRTMLSPFATVTGRNAPSRFIFGQAKWMRMLIKAPPGYALGAIDWSQQELGVSAVLSSDEARQQAYRGDKTRDFYMILADIIRCTRSEAKTFTLAEQYGAGVALLARRMRRQPFVIRRILRDLHRAYPAFYDWSQRIVNVAYREGKLETALGWQILAPKHGANTRTLRNFLSQGYGADLLRLSVARAVDHGINVIGTMHDSVLIEARTTEIDTQVAAMLEIMAEASRELLDGFELRAKAEVHTRYDDEAGHELWFKILKILDDCQ